MKKILLTFMGILCALSSVWADDITLYSIDFTALTPDDAVITSEKTINTLTGVGTPATDLQLKGYKSSNVTIDATNGLTFTGNNLTASAGAASAANYYIAIPVSGVNGSLTVTTTGAATKWYYSYTTDAEQSTIAARAQASANHGFTITGLTNSNVTIYIGCNAKNIKTLTVTTPSKTQWDAPTFTVGAWNSADKAYPVTISAENGATISYKIGEGEYQTYSAPVNVAANATIYAKAVGGSYAESAVASKTMDDEPGDVVLKEKVVYQTNFQDWTKSSASTEAPVFVTQTTTDNQELTFKLVNTAVDPAGTNSKFTAECCTTGYLQTNKDDKNILTPYIELSALKSVTKLEIVQAATGGKRGITVAVKGDGDEDWVKLHDVAIANQSGETLTFDVNRTNCQIMIGSFDKAQNAYVLSMKIEGMVEVPARTFKDFKIDFRTETPTVLLPESGELPQGVEVVLGTYKDGQHGTMNTKVTVPVDGPVKFTVGACKYTNTKATVTINGETTKTIENKTSCDGGVGSYNNFVTYVYNVEEPATLVFDLGEYCPYFFAEACEFTPSVTVDYYDTDGKLIGSDVVDGGSPLAYKYGVSDVTVESGKAFRGWFENNTATALKVAEGKEVLQDLKLYAKATDIEIATVGSLFTYNLNQANFYPEDHELFSTTGKFHDGQHGFDFAAGQSLSVETAGNAIIVLSLCQFSAESNITVTDASDNVIATIPAKVASDGTTATINYNGEPTTITATMGGTTYIHKVEVYNVNEIPEKDENDCYTVTSGDTAGLLLVLAQLQNGDKVFIPNGTYDFGTEENITISASNVTITGESMGGVIIKNTPAVEGLKKGLFYNKGTNNVFENLTLQSYAPWGSNNGQSAERAHAFWDEGDKTVCKNVYLKGYQDTYFSNNRNMTAYFFGGMIEGTTDFICGSGKVYFDNVFINCVNSEHKTSGDVIIAPQPFADSKENEPNFGYIFNNCSINCEGTQRGTYYLGRGWGQTTGSEVDEWIYAIFAGCKFAEFAGFTTGAMNGSELTILVQDDGVNLIETNNNGVASFVALAPMDFTEEQDITAYLCTAVTAESVTLVKAEKVPAGAAFVVVGMPDTRYTISLTASDSYVTNLFKAGAYTVQANENVYALNTKGQFQKVAAGVTVPVGKAYLKTDVALTKTISIIDEDTTTGINSANSEVVKGVRKAIVDGQLRIVTPNGMFTTTGAQVK